jgi:hypothetical protein
MNQRLMTQNRFSRSAQNTRLAPEDNEGLLTDILSSALKRDSYQEFRRVMFYAIVEYPNLFVNEDFSEEQVQQIEESFSKESYLDFRRILVPIEACCGTRECVLRRKCRCCCLLDAAKSLAYEEFREILALALLE